MTEQPGASGLTHSSGTPAGTPAIVDVYADPAPGGGVGFSHDWHWQNGPSQGSGTVEIPKKTKNDPGTPIHFNLVDRTGRGFDFSDDIFGAIWVNRDDCPDSQCGDDQIPQDQIQRSPNLLRVFDLNTEDCRLHYRLRFKDKAGESASYDPDIKNGGTSVA